MPVSCRDPDPAGDPPPAAAGSTGLNPLFPQGARPAPPRRDWTYHVHMSDSRSSACHVDMSARSEDDDGE